MMSYTEEIYEIIKNDTEGFDAVYEDYIVKIVGLRGLIALLENRLLESCGVVNGRQLYAIV